MKRKIILYETEGGASPVAKFVRKLNRGAQVRVAAAFEHIELDTQTAHLFCKMVNTDGLWEIRIKHDRNIFRLLCFFDGKTVVVVASGFQKKTQKTPRQEIKTAEARMRDYFRRKNQ
jgi:phage-related protein